jgi:hypothetical protein
MVPAPMNPILLILHRHIVARPPSGPTRRCNLECVFVKAMVNRSTASELTT